MPTLFRLLVIVALLAAIVYGTMLTMVTFLRPQQREISQTITLPSASK